MIYDLGVDLGTAVARAAICRTGDGLRPRTESVPLDGRTGLVSALYLGANGAVLIGEAAARRGSTEPSRVHRPDLALLTGGAPVVVDGSARRPEELAAALLRGVVRRVAEREEEPAEQIAVAHPASWDVQAQELFVQALREPGRPDLVLVPEPVAAAMHVAARGGLETGRTAAVFDFGGGSLDAAVVHREGPGRFALLGAPVAIITPCGADLEEILFTRLLAGVGDRVGPLDAHDPEVLAAMSRLLDACVAAKEALSCGSAVTVPLQLPGHYSEVRVTRSAFEAMIRPTLQAAVHGLCTALPGDADAVLLVGGSARIPLVAELLTAELSRPVTADPHATTAVALGTALAASRARRHRGAGAVGIAALGVAHAGAATPVTRAGAALLAASAVAASAVAASDGAATVAVGPGVPARRRTLRIAGATAGVALMAAIALPLALTSGAEPSVAGPAAGAQVPTPEFGTAPDGVPAAPGATSGVPGATRAGGAILAAAQSPFAAAVAATWAPTSDLIRMVAPAGAPAIGSTDPTGTPAGPRPWPAFVFWPSPGGTTSPPAPPAAPGSPPPPAPTDTAPPLTPPPVPSPTPTPAPEPRPTPTPNPEPTPTPTPEPSPTPTPAPEPTKTPGPEPEPEHTETAVSTPTARPDPAPSPTDRPHPPRRGPQT